MNRESENPHYPKILFFEYAVGSGEIVDKDILEEGRLMYDTILNHFLSSGHQVTSLIDEKYYNSQNNSSNFNVISLNKNDDYISKIENILDEVDMALIIAPECENILYELTKLIEKHKVINIGSSSKGVKIAGNKYLTYEAIKEAVKTPKTYPLKKYVIKETSGCGGAHQVLDEEYVIQEFVEGAPYSVSFIVGQNDKIYPICLNRQYINDIYCGGEVNINHPLKEEIIKESEKALRKIDGLNGYVGVDVLVGEKINILEINPRITTSVCGISTDPSLGSLLVDNALGREINFTVNVGKRFIRKEDGFEFL
ncbi:MAG: tyramine---L-glutamate ligase [Methanothermococcus sp.]|uniref:tyramine--L-glutamate ligase n=1 Tax=Methanothermococcus sp. TaxID=2614238 RepID=UPI0025869E40|nr:tyramine--L-glutamate ligase [Methanothermococcus sp.]MDK2790823.1 tyramine---L-glutamate ligase [Methanothermococcus sp.]MDK2978961.1 tyramine---L-glutamate ligase [Bacteroidales bacterium]